MRPSMPLQRELLDIHGIGDVDRDDERQIDLDVGFRRAGRQARAGQDERKADHAATQEPNHRASPVDHDAL